MKFTSTQIGLLFSLVGGFILILVGAYMMVTGISAEGVIDLKSPLVSGSLQSGSAGLFLSFFGGLIVLASLGALFRLEKSSGEGTVKKTRNEQAFTFVSLLICAKFPASLFESLGYSGFLSLNSLLNVVIIFTLVSFLFSNWQSK